MYLGAMCATIACQLACSGRESSPLGEPERQVENSESQVKKHTETVTVEVQIPEQTRLEDYVLIATDYVRIETDGRVGSDTEGNDDVLAHGAINLKEQARVYGNLYTPKGVRMEAGSRLTGDIHATGIVLRDDDSYLTGFEHQAELVMQQHQISITAPRPTNATVNVVAGEQRMVSPGGYSALNVDAGGYATLSSGEYSFAALNLALDGFIEIDASNGPVRIVVRDTLMLDGHLNLGAPQDVLLIFQAEAEITMLGRIKGTLVAPLAKIQIGDRLEGAVIAHRVIVDPNANAYGGPFVHAANDPVSPAPAAPGRIEPLGSISGCSAEFDVEYSDSDVDGDGEPDIVRLIPRGADPECEPIQFCRKITNDDGTDSYEVLPESSAIYSEALPIPAEAVSQGCSAEPGHEVCPTLPNGQLALGCEPDPADPACLTITMCPDPGSVMGGPGPAPERQLTEGNLTSLDSLMPADAREVEEGEVLRLDSAQNSLYIHPCEWDTRVHSYATGFDVTGNKKGGGAECESDDECNSGVCDKGDGALVFYGMCTPMESPLGFKLLDGPKNFGVQAGAGIPEGRSRVERAAFYPSAHFDVTSSMNAYAYATIFGKKLTLLDAEIRSQLTECEHRLEWSADAFQSDLGVIKGKLGETLEPYEVAAFSMGDIDTDDDVSTSIQVSQCLAAKSALQNAERHLNETFHDALIAATYFNLAGGTGYVVKDYSTAQAFVDKYEAAAKDYEAALATFLREQEVSLSHDNGAMVADHAFGINVGYHVDYPLGPFTIGLELGGFGEAGVESMRVENSVNMAYTGRDMPCDGVECMRARTESSGATWAHVGAYGYVSAGIGVGKLGAHVGITAELDLATFEVPMTSNFALERVIWDGDEAIEAARGRIPAPLQEILGNSDAALTANTFVVQPRVAQFQAPFAVGGGINDPGDLSVKARFLDGRIKAWAKIKAFFVSLKWEKKLIDWQGFETSWKIADGNTGDALQAQIGIPVPNMVLLPKLVVNPEGGTASPSDTQIAINRMFDAREVPSGQQSSTHREDSLGLPWDADGERCRTQTIIY